MNTKRLSISILTLNDAAFIFELVNTEGWKRFIGEMKMHTIEAASSYVKRVLETPDVYYWIARQNEDNKPVGIITFLKRASLSHFDLGFAMLPEYEGKGYAFEASAYILNVVIKDYPIINAVTHSENSKSIVLLEKLGFQLDETPNEDNSNTITYTYKRV